MPSIVLTAIVAYFLVLTPRVTYFAYGDGSSGWSTSWPALDAFSTAGFVTVIVGVAMGRRRPVWGTILALLPFLAVPAMGGFVWGWWLGLLAIAALAALDGVRRAVVPAVAAVLVIVWYCGTETPAFLPHRIVTTSGSGTTYEWPTLLLYLFWIAATVAVAAAIGSHRRSRARDAGARETEQHALEVESLAGERARLARDLHDVVAHHVSAMGVQAGAARTVLERDPEAATRALAGIEASSRSALDELRHLLETLRTPDAVAAPADSTVRLSALPDLVAHAAHNGLPTTLTIVGDPVEPSELTQVNLYRIAQEALTNARRHSGPDAAADVRLRYSADAVELEIANTGRPQPGARPGLGLVGMRERAVASGGTLEAGPRPRGGYLVRARLPLGAGVSA